MARCSGVFPIAPIAFITSASVFHSFVFSSSLKSWSTVVGLVPSNRRRTLSFFFMLGHPSGAERSRGIPRKHLKFSQRDVSTSLDMTKDYFVRLNLPVKR